MSQHDVMLLKMCAGTIVCGLALGFFAYGAGLVWRNWEWWSL